MASWKEISLPLETLPKGDMPGDKLEINDSHIHRAKSIFPVFMDWLKAQNKKKVVLSVYGGSGVGKSEIGSLLAYQCREAGYGTYLLSGDNYPFRIPEENDKERHRIFRYAGLLELENHSPFSNTQMDQLQSLWKDDKDLLDDHDWLEKYRIAGSQALRDYLGTEQEIDFDLINRIIRRFKQGDPVIPLKRMGRSAHELSLEPVDMRNTSILIIEWTHGNNSLLKGVDYPVFLFSTPEETLAHRLSRARDKGADSPFVSLVLKLEQEKLLSRAEQAALIVSREGEILSLEDLNRRAVKHD